MSILDHNAQSNSTPPLPFRPRPYSTSEHLSRGSLSPNRTRRVPANYLYGPDIPLKDYLPSGLHKYLLAARLLLHLIEVRRSIIAASRNEFVSLKSEYLRNLLGRNVEKRIREALEAAGVIECDHRYVIGSKSMGYRLGAEFRNLPFVRFDLPERMAMAFTKERLKPEGRIQKYLCRNLENVTIDYNGAVSSLLPEEVINKILSIEMIHDQHFYFSPDPFGQRVHTNITNFSKKLRPYLRLKGQPLVNLDIKNSQPVFLAHTIRNFPTFMKTPRTCVQPLTERKEREYKERGRGKSQYNTMAASLQPVDVKEVGDTEISFFELCENGNLYEALMELWSIDDRAEAKKAFLRDVLFCKPHANRNQKLFRLAYPDIYAAIHEMKQGDYKRPARLLQRAESDLVINNVAAECMRREIPLLTIHDSALTPHDYASTVKEIMLDAFRQLGITAVIAVEELG